MADVHITNNFYGNVGQQIDHIDHQEVHFDKDMNLVLPNENQAQSAEAGDNSTTEHTEGHGKPLCSYIIPNDIKPMEEVEREMAAAAHQNARTLAQYIKCAVRLGYIDLRSDNGKQVYEMLKSHFGFTFSYKTWIAYY